MKILIVSNSPWRNDNSFGNSYTNIFEGIPDIEIANIFCKYGNPQTTVASRFFQITEKSLIKNFLKKTPSGREVFLEKTCIEESNDGVELFNIARKQKTQLMFWLRDIIWKFGRWKSKELVDFVDDFKPDLIFQPVYFSSHITNIARFIKKHTDVPMVGYISDDCYTLRQFSLSPLYWVDRLFKRRMVKRTIEQCEILYVISDIQKAEYEKIFTPPCKILTKCADFSGEAPNIKISDNEIRMVYAGNISKGRGESLSYITQAIERLNNEGYNVLLDIYSGTPVTDKLSENLSRKGCYFHGKVTYSEVQNIEQNADILIHVEGLSLKERLAVHQSFSTKLVDFFEMGKCIFAVGSYDEAFAKHLIDNDAAVVATNKEQVYIKLKELIENRDLITEYGKKAYDCGKKHHNKADVQGMLREDLMRISTK